MTEPSEKMLLKLAARYGVPITDDKDALDRSIKLAAAQRRKQRRQAGKRDRDYMVIMNLFTQRYSVTSAEFASAMKMPIRRARDFLRRLEQEGVLLPLHRANRQIHYTLRTP
jgi:ribosomal protein S25